MWLINFCSYCNSKFNSLLQCLVEKLIEILKNYEVLSFILKNIKKYFDKPKNIYNNDEIKKDFSKYYENKWIKK